MKKILIIAALVILPLLGSAQKATDVSKRNVTFYMENVETNLLYNFYFYIKLKNTVPISGYSCKITLPEPFVGTGGGLGLVEAYGPHRTILNVDGGQSYIMGREPIVNSMEEWENPKAWNIFCCTSAPKYGHMPMTIPVADEQIFQINYMVMGDVEPGYYPVTITDQVFSTPNGKVIKVPDSVGYIYYNVNSF